ncbi:MAG: hypothetical protein P8O20_05140 [Bacteroidia bacterium]|nr:hypothetical protein [Bacteroidia bacterium]
MRFLISIFLVVAVIYGCEKESNSNPIPSLELKGYNVLSDSSGKDSLIQIYLSYRDGDGDLGLGNDNLAYPFGYTDPYFYNLFVDYYVKESGAFIKKINPLSPTRDTIAFHERFQSLTPTGKTKRIYGDITLYIPAFPFGTSAERVKFTAHIVDRALNKSRRVSTSEIILNP